MKEAMLEQKCSICHSSVFKPYRGRPNAKCSKCFSLERHRDAWEILAGMNMGRVLYIGPEPCLARKVRSNCQSFMSCDLYPKYSTTLKQDLQNTSFQDKQFDIAICLHVLEHIVDSQKAMRELARISHIAIISVPLSTELTYRDCNATTAKQKVKAHGQRNHEWMFGVKDFVDILMRNGFVECINHKGAFKCVAGPV